MSFRAQRGILTLNIQLLRFLRAALGIFAKYLFCLIMVGITKIDKFPPVQN
jgi:hypothetical protein